MPRTFGEFAAFAAPAVFLLLWSSGFVLAKLGLQYAEPLTYLAVRMTAVVAILAVIIAVTKPKWPNRAGLVHSAAAGFMVHGLYLGGVFISIENGLSAGLAALIVSLQPVLTSTIANRWLGERVTARQWLGLALGLLGVYLVMFEKTGSGGVTLPAWFAVIVALIGITVGTLYQKLFGGSIDWRPALLIQYGTADILFSLARWPSRRASCIGRRNFCSPSAISPSCSRSARCGSITTSSAARRRRAWSACSISPRRSRR